MRAAAQLGGEVANADDAHAVAVLFAEERHRVVLVDGDVDGHVLDHLDAVVAQHLPVGEVFDVLQLFVVDRGEVREVEAQMRGIDQRARLLHVLAQHIAQRGMQKVRAGVVAHGGAADFVVDHRVHFVADVDGLLGDDAVRAHALHGIGHAFNFGDDGVVVFAVEPADIADLSARIGVERRVIEHDLAALAGLQLLRANSGAVVRLDDGQHLASGGERLVIALELGARERLVQRAGRGFRAALPGSLRALALLVHGGVEAGRVERDS